MSININSFVNLTAETVNMTADGNITVSKSLVSITGANCPTIQGINVGGSIPTGQTLTLIAGNKFKIHQDNNIRLKDSTSLIPQKQSISFIYDGAHWIETSRTRDTDRLEWGGNASSSSNQYIDYNSYGSASSVQTKHKAFIYRTGTISRLSYMISTQSPTQGTLKLIISNGTQVVYSYQDLINAGSVINNTLCGKIELDYDVAFGDDTTFELSGTDFGHTRLMLSLS